MPVDITSTWIPLSLLAALCLYMYILFQRERREAIAYENELAAAGGDHDASAHASPAVHAEPAHAAPAASYDHSDASASKKASLAWRTAYLWLPIVAGFGWQAYIDIIKPMLEQAGQ